MNKRILIILICIAILITYLSVRFDLLKIIEEKYNVKTVPKEELNTEDDEKSYNLNIPESGVVDIKLIDSKSNELLTISAEIARTDHEKEIGLMYRENLDENKGMIFVYEKDTNSKFWMKNCEIFLDIIFIDENGIIIEIVENAPPCEEEFCKLYGTIMPYRYVLEINGGLATKKGIKNGDKLITIENND